MINPTIVRYYFRLFADYLSELVCSEFVVSFWTKGVGVWGVLVPTTTLGPVHFTEGRHEVRELRCRTRYPWCPGRERDGLDHLLSGSVGSEDLTGVEHTSLSTVSSMKVTLVGRKG